ncbi:MAG TPA: primosomal protein N' [Flavobacterium sp.]|nr:primosomal protein N' [Flavobacterium sp.]
MQYFIEVIVPLKIPSTFTYQVSEAEFQFLNIGYRVAVPFGKSKIYTALVTGKHHQPPLKYQAKEIIEIIDEKAIATPMQIDFWHWIADYYMCTLGEVYRAAIPGALLLETETLVKYNSKENILLSGLTDQEYLIYEALQQQPILTVKEITTILDSKKILPTLQLLIQKNVIYLHEETRESYKPKLIKYVRLHEKYQEKNELKNLLQSVKTEKQRNVVLCYFQLNANNPNPISVNDLKEKAQVTKAVIDNLAKNDIFEIYTLAQDRVVFNNTDLMTIQLSDIQQQALTNIQNEFTQKDIQLLHGVTGSGKTEIYCKLIDQYVNQNKQVLFLLPEIALTTQLVQRLTAYFGNKVAVYHSKYTENERVEVWKNVLENKSSAQIIIGARSAIFLPFADLGLIIVDEEHEASYKQQDPAPRYQGRDLAIVLAKMMHAKTLLGSATPSLESFYNAYQEKYALTKLTKRYGNSIVPQNQLIDLKGAYQKKQMTGHFSNHLIEEMKNVLAKGEQIILFQNRRGFSPVMECLSCGHVPQCTHCDVSLTYYKRNDVLKCHYCGYTIAKPTHCHVCSSVDVSTKGFGTEQIEIELHHIFPEAKVARMDQDTTRGKFALEKIIDAFKNKETDMLVGTQMLAKGLDFDNVTLVGILNADNLLYYPDFRAHERAYQLLTQVAGRAGRKDKEGKVFIQTYNPMHSIIQQMLNHRYQEMFKEQMQERLQFRYPPFYRLIRIQLKHADYQKVKEASEWLVQSLTSQIQSEVLGPEEPAVNRIRNQYLRNILIKTPVNQSIKNVKNQINKTLKSFEAIPQYKSVKMIVNVDFY